MKCVECCIDNPNVHPDSFQNGQSTCRGCRFYNLVLVVAASLFCIGVAFVVVSEIILLFRHLHT